MPLLSSATGRCFAAFMGSEGHDAQRIGPMVREELARLKKLPRNGPVPLDLPTSMTEVNDMLDEVRRRGLARVVHSLQASVGGFSAPVFDVQGRLVLAMVVLGSVATLDTAWEGGPATALRDAARRLSADLGHREADGQSDDE